MSKIDNYNIMEVMRVGLESDIKARLEVELEESIVKPMLDDFEAKVRGIVYSSIEAVTIDSVAQFRDMANLMDEVKVLVNVESTKVD